jgi:transcriptional regulator with XRE-family HTH domain
MYPNLKLQLWKTGIRQNRLAKLLGVDEAVLSKIVNGFREPSVEMRVKIAQLLQSDQAWLFEQEQVSTEPTSASASPRPVES